MKRPANCSATNSAHQLLLQPLAQQLVDGRERLVEEQQVGPRDERPRQRGAHLHAAGELVRQVALEARPGRRGRAPPASARDASPSGSAVQLGEELDVAHERAARRAGSPAGTRSRAGRRAAPRDPTSARSRPATMRSTVDLPQPDGPTIVRNSPRAEVEVDALSRRAVPFGPGLPDAAQPEHGHAHDGGILIRRRCGSQPFPSVDAPSDRQRVRCSGR